MPTLEDYCACHTTPLDDGLACVYRSVMLHTANPHMASSPYQGAFLRLLASMVQPDIAVEVGSHAGFGALCIAEGMAGKGTLHLIEAEEEYEPLIRGHARTAGVGHCLQLHIGQAAELIPTLPDGIGFAYVDADKENYGLYYSLLLPKMKRGGVMLFDNMLWYGGVLGVDSGNGGTVSHLRSHRDARAIHSLNGLITADARVDNILLPIRDGLMLCRVK